MRWPSLRLQLLLLSMVVAGGVRAQTLGVLGAGVRSSALASGGAALVDDYNSVFLCPAMMSFGPPSLGFGVMGGVNRLGIRLSERPAGYDRGLTLSGDGIELAERSSPPNPSDLVGFLAGGSNSLGIDWLRLGAIVYLPLIDVGRQDTYFADERESYFTNTLRQEIYGGNLSASQVALAAALRPFPWLALGVGVQIASRSRSDAAVLVPDPGDTSRQDLNLSVSTGAVLSPIGSVAASAWGGRLRLAAVFRDEVVLSVRGKTQGWLVGGDTLYPFEQSVVFVLGYTPRQALVSLALRMARFSLAADYEWQEWSRYRGAHGERAGFDDAWRASAGGELRPLEHLTLLAGFGFRRSPVPAQTGRTNYVDDDKYVPSLGAIYEFRMEGKTIEIGLFSQLHLARGRSVEKAPADGASPPCGSGVEELCDEDPLTSGLQTSNPGFPGFSSGGWVWVSGAQVTWRYQ